MFIHHFGKNKLVELKFKPGFSESKIEHTTTILYLFRKIWAEYNSWETYKSIFHIIEYTQIWEFLSRASNKPNRVIFLIQKGILWYQFS